MVYRRRIRCIVVSCFVVDLLSADAAWFVVEFAACCAQHRHGSGHHAPWDDVVALEFPHSPRRY